MVRLPRLVDACSDLSRELLGQPTVDEALKVITAAAVDTLPGVEWASITRRRGETFTTSAATDGVALAADHVQYELGTGPCVDAVVSGRTSVLDGADVQWPEFAAAVAPLGIHAVLSVRLGLSAEDAGVGLNMYATEPDTFGEDGRLPAVLLATVAATALAAVVARERAAHLERALLSNREIGTATGVLMATQKLTRDQAFELLRLASQTTNRKLVDVATEVVDTGVLQNDRRPGRAV